MTYRDRWTLGEVVMTNVPIDDQVRLSPGAPVEVRVAYHGSWSCGFEIESVRQDGYVLRRQSDGATLPKRFPRSELRPKR
jgi:hypothetical protein